MGEIKNIWSTKRAKKSIYLPIVFARKDCEYWLYQLLQLLLPSFKLIAPKKDKMIELKGMHLNHNIYVVVGKQCRTENAWTGIRYKIYKITIFFVIIYLLKVSYKIRYGISFFFGNHMKNKTSSIFIYIFDKNWIKKI